MNQWEHVKAQKHWNYTADRLQSDKQKGKSFHSLGETFCARLLHQQTRLRLMHWDRAHPPHPSPMIQATRWNHRNWPPLTMTSADRRLQRPDVEIDTPLPRSESNEHVSASCHCHPLSITVGWPQTPSSPIRNQSRGRFESNLPCAPHPANGAQSAHIWLAIWLCLGHSVGKVISLRAPATKILQDYIHLSSLCLAEVFEGEARA